mgnify:CR=1 FL=1
MKGIAWILYLFITLIITSIIAIYGWYVIGGSIGEALATNTKLMGQQITGIINLLQSSPSGTLHEYELVKADGNLKIKDEILEIRIRIGTEKFYTTHLIQHIPVRDIDIKFTPTERKIFLARCSNEIIVTKNRDDITCVKI